MPSMTAADLSSKIRDIDLAVRHGLLDGTIANVMPTLRPRIVSLRYQSLNSPFLMLLSHDYSRSRSR